MAASEVSYDNTTSGMTATTTQGAVDELNASLVNYEDTTSSNTIIFDEQGKRRLLTFNRATYSNLQTYVNNLSASDRPITTAVAPLVRLRSASGGGYIYGTMGFIYIPNSGNLYIGLYLTYNASNGYESTPNNDDLLVGQVEWYVN